MMMPESANNILDNIFFDHAFTAWLRLKDIRDEKIPYISDDYSILINTLERFYKGFLQSKLSTNKEFTLPKDYLTNDHDLLKLTKKIEKFTPLFNCKNDEERNNKNIFFRNIRKQYTSSRYSEFISKTDFDKLYDFVEAQKSLLLNHLQNKDKSIQEEFSLDL